MWLCHWPEHSWESSSRYQWQPAACEEGSRKGRRGERWQGGTRLRAEVSLALRVSDLRRERSRLDGGKGAEMPGKCFSLEVLKLWK